ncbi:MAG: (d)CMP kinase [Gemmatimonadetes bacterium]|nr:(d)CMP kinase [Gemmatimonadota bacterium]
MVIAIDGPAASGKSSTARAVAAALGYRHLDSGAFYRALTLALLRSGIPEQEWDSLTASDLAQLQVAGVAEAGGYLFRIGSEEVTGEIRSPAVSASVSRVAAIPAVRDWLLGTLRAAGAKGGLVADGRDIGTVVFPDAELKVFLVCAPQERALRRLREQGDASASVEDIRAEAERLRTRDHLDSSREVAPLLRAADAITLDTTGLAFNSQVDAILRLARTRAGG